ncbi:MAG: BatD family protein, partial [Prevotella sp.]|nr:BatD family protein [Prevotella sp.]
MLMMGIEVFAQHFTAKAPSTVVVGDQFRLTFTVNTQDVDHFQQPNFPDDIEVLMGPSVSTQSSFQMVNG